MCVRQKSKTINLHCRFEYARNRWVAWFVPFKIRNIFRIVRVAIALIGFGGGVGGAVGIVVVDGGGGVVGLGRLLVIAQSTAFHLDILVILVKLAALALSLSQHVTHGHY